MAAKIRQGDEVIVIAGKDARHNDKPAKVGKVLRVLTAEHKVIVEGVNLVKKHQKPKEHPSGSPWRGRRRAYRPPPPRSSG